MHTGHYKILRVEDEKIKKLIFCCGDVVVEGRKGGW